MRGHHAAVNITMVRPPLLQMAKSLSALGAILPIGLAYVAAALREAGHNIRAIDAPGEALDRFLPVRSPVGTLLLNGLTPEEIVDRLDPATEILGITHMFLHEWPTVREIAERAKARLPDLVVVLGGENATAFREWIFTETNAVDYCVLGEGEATMLELVARLQEGEPTDDIPGLASRRATGAPRGPATRITRLDTIPWPAWEYFPVERYLGAADGYGVNRGRSMPMLATRGCPYRCTFCSSSNMWTTRYVTRSPRDVIEEMKSYVRRYRIGNVDFCDLTAIIKREWIVEFCQRLKEERLDLTWQLPAGTRSEAVDEEVLRLAYETGCRNITYAPESGSERMLRIIKKEVKIPRLLNSLRAASRVGVVTRVNIIVGHPAEERRDLWQSVKLLVKAALIGAQDTAVMIFAPYPGSRDFEELMAAGEIEMSAKYYCIALARAGSSSTTYNARIRTRELILWQFGMLLAFYGISYLARPWRLVRLIRSALTGYEETQVDQLVRTKLRQLRAGIRPLVTWRGRVGVAPALPSLTDALRRPSSAKWVRRYGLDRGHVEARRGP